MRRGPRRSPTPRTPDACAPNSVRVASLAGGRVEAVQGRSEIWERALVPVGSRSQSLGELADRRVRLEGLVDQRVRRARDGSQLDADGVVEHAPPVGEA